VRRLAIRPERPTIALEEALGLWRVGRGVSEDVVDAAVVALVAGADSPVLRELAGVQRRFAGGDVVEYVDAVQRELDIVPLDPEIVIEYQARDILETLLDGELTPRAAASRVGALFPHGLWTDPLAGICYCDERYSLCDEVWNHERPADIDVEVVRDALLLTAR
jgi:hypothetical protein